MASYEFTEKTKNKIRQCVEMWYDKTEKKIQDNYELQIAEIVTIAEQRYREDGDDSEEDIARWKDSETIMIESERQVKMRKLRVDESHINSFLEVSVFDRVYEDKAYTMDIEYNIVTENEHNGFVMDFEYSGISNAQDLDMPTLDKKDMHALGNKDEDAARDILTTLQNKHKSQTTLDEFMSLGI